MVTQDNELQEAFQEVDKLRHLAQVFIARVPLIFDQNGLWWRYRFDENRWRMTDETDILRALTDQEGVKLDSTIPRSRTLLEAIKIEARRYCDEVRELKPTEIVLGNCLYDINTKVEGLTGRGVFTVNPIPHKLRFTSETPTIDRLFKEWVGAEYVQTLHEIVAYCCYRDYPIHTMFFLVGGGCNGKGQFLKFLGRFLGGHNMASTSLDRLSTRFETVKLYKKLAAVMGETDFGVLAKTDIIKRLTGGDLIPYEVKGGKLFDAHNYAKVIIGTNHLPISDDDSVGFYRRCIVIDFPHQFKDGRDVVDDIPEEEYGAEARKVIDMLPTLLKRGTFTNQGSIEERRKRYVERSNPLGAFLRDCCVKNADGHAIYGDAFVSFNQYSKGKLGKTFTKRQFSQVLDRENIEHRATYINNQREHYIFGYELKPLSEFEREKPCDRDVRDVSVISTHPSYIELSEKQSDKTDISVTAPLTPEFFPQEMKAFEEFREWLGKINEKASYENCSLMVRAIHERRKIKVDEATTDEWLAKLTRQGDAIEVSPGFYRALR